MKVGKYMIIDGNCKFVFPMTNKTHRTKINKDIEDFINVITFDKCYKSP